MKSEVLAKAKFRVSAPNGETYTVDVTLEPYGGFQYGNGHGVALDRHAGCGVEWFDARYDPRFDSVDTFNTNVIEFVQQQFRDDFTIERIA